MILLIGDGPEKEKLEALAPRDIIQHRNSFCGIQNDAGSPDESVDVFVNAVAL